jgi:3-dehydroquinate dehydratase-2
MSYTIHIINGPNLNLLGTRQPEIYGNETLETIQSNVQTAFPQLAFSFFQSNIEGEIIDAIQTSKANGMIINAGGFSHTSVAIADAITSISIPIISVHISNIYQREVFRHIDLIGEKCQGSIIGLGIKGYELAVDCLIDKWIK